MKSSSHEKAPEFIRWLVEPETLETAGYERQVDWIMPATFWDGESADRLRALLDAPSPGRRAAFGRARRYELDPRRPRFAALAAGRPGSETSRRAGVGRVTQSPVPYQSPPRWDVYAPRLRALAIVNSMAAESNVLGHL